MFRIGIDIGGTKVNMGLVDEQGKVRRKARLATADAPDPRVLAGQIAEAVRAMVAEEGLTMDDVAFLGAGVPGTVDTRTGLVSYCPNTQWFDVPLGDYFREELGREVLVAQDSRNGALAEKLFGAGRAYSDIICITIGTGIGCGIVLGNRVFNGGMNTAGEIGHTPIYKDQTDCLCGNRGCLERYVSGNTIFERAFKLYPEKFAGRKQVCESVFDLAYEGDKDILALIDICMDDLAYAIANAINLLSPQAIIISGGLSVHEDLVVKPLKEKIYARGYYAWTRLNQLEVLSAQLGSDAPMIGAAFVDKGL